jgi:hypothetical protein
MMSGDIHMDAMEKAIASARECAISLKDEAVAYQNSKEYRMLCALAEQFKEYQECIATLKEARKLNK